nr:MAG TPA: hypothetical protein [Caudoviricetes sp.]
MNKEMEKYLHKIFPNAFWINKQGNRYCQSVHGKSYVRYNEAKKQAESKPVDKEIIIKYTLAYLNRVGIKTTKNPKYENPKYIDYDDIQQKFQLNDRRDLVWMKFTKDGYLGVVAVSDDVNFDMPENCSVYDKKHIVYNAHKKRKEEEWVHNSAGIIVHKLGKEWDDSFVLIFPLKGIPEGYTRLDVETAIGNMLIEKNIPILDFYSHMY